MCAAIFPHKTTPTVCLGFFLYPSSMDGSNWQPPSYEESANLMSPGMVLPDYSKFPTLIYMAP